MARRLPSLTALRAFEAAARHLSFTRAAGELNVTQGAVSHQVKALERELGLKLFLRQKQGLALTEHGRHCLASARDAFDRLAAGMTRLRERAETGVLSVNALPSFAAKWLMPRLPRFLAVHPEVDLRVSAFEKLVSFDSEDVDLAVRLGPGRWPGLDAVRLMEDVIFPVCSPKLLAGPQGLRRPRDLARANLIHNEFHNKWADWLKAAGVDGVDLSRGLVFDQPTFGINAAIDGQGVVLTRFTLVMDDLLAGRLARPFAPTLPVETSYYIVCPEANSALPKVVRFRDWMLAEAARDLERWHALTRTARTARR
jgi:LysR family glycine cleavage system transcriptional activator